MLLFIERPGHQLDYLVGALSPEGLEGGYGDPHAPRSILLPPFPGRAAQALTDRYLPSYEQAVHARQTAAIAAVLGDIRAESDTWQVMNASGHYSDATPLSDAAVGAATELFLDHAWRRFLTVVDHAPTLLNRCRPADSPWPDDAALSRLAAAVIDAEAWSTRSSTVVPCRSRSAEYARGRRSRRGSPTAKRSCARPA
ncbi:hypothetical protein ABZZ16_41095 [Streptomyces sp. NPDC006386]|uniref:hypothetical protein n=1 Tax=Streptomyces sp. NPDC006386 TaxID=3156762 RepID=UPI0033A3243B